MAVKENVKVLGINDFCSTGGHLEFQKNCLNNNIYPLLNIEYLAFDQDLSDQNIRINDPVNAGRMYLVGKGLKNNLSGRYSSIFFELRNAQKELAKKIILKVNEFFDSKGEKNKIDYEEIQLKIAKDFIGERHIAKAIKDNFNVGTMTETEIRNKFLKKNGIAYIKEPSDIFLNIFDCIEMIRNAGGVPCYPVLFDNKNGEFTEYEKDLNQLYKNLKKLDIKHLDIFPDRNNINNVYRIVSFFKQKGFHILFGTEHNTEEIKPITVKTQNKEKLENTIISTAYDGCCSIASHQNGGNLDDIRYGNEIIKSYI
jgi:hypothetical protein